MTCPSQVYSGLETKNTPWKNWSNRVAGPVSTFSTPDTLADLVNILDRATKAGRQVRVVGSGWAFENIAFSPDWMVSMVRLKKPLTAVTSSALNAQWALHQSPGSNDVLFEIEAGASIADVNDALAAVGLGMPTLGGANGQALAGAISTSTHGGDFATPPIADFVVAMHVVTVGGREVWLERASQPITDDMALATVLTCPDTEILRNDVLFDAMLVGFGRFGVIYSYVLRVKRAYRLAEWTIQLPGNVVTTQLRLGLTNGTFLKALLLILPDPPAALKAFDVKNPRGLEVVFDTQNLNLCWVKRRWLTNDATNLNIVNAPNDLCTLGAAGVLGIGIAALTGLMLIPPWLLAPFLVTVQQTALTASLAQNPSMTAGEMLSRVLSAIWTLGAQAAIGPIVAEQFRKAYLASTTTGIRGPSSIVLSGFREQSLQTCFRADSIEPIFDAHSPQYLDFLNLMIALAPTVKQAGYISLRWSAKSRATLSMHNFTSAHAVAIEITSLRGLPDNNTWMSTIETHAKNFGGRPHWGQINTLTAVNIATLYGKQFKQWTDVLTLFTGGSTTFSSAHTVQRGLEPSNPKALPTLFGIRAADLLGALTAAISLLLSDPEPLPSPIIFPIPIPRPIPRPPRL